MVPDAQDGQAGQDGRCARCGAELDGEAEQSERCPRCGALVAAPAGALPFPPDPYGVPIARFSPTRAGPPVAPEPYVTTDSAWQQASPLAGAPPPSARLRIMLPQSARRRGRLPLWLATLLAALVLAGLATAAGVVARDAGLNLPLGAPTNQAQPTEPPPTATPACLARPIVPHAAAALTQATLTTGLRNPATQDFRPVDSVTTFRAGQRVYITFEVATAEAGTADVSFCTPAGQIPGTLDIPARSNGHYAQFSLPLDATHTGPSVVTLSWNGAVAASLPFTIVAPGGP